MIIALDEKQYDRLSEDYSDLKVKYDNLKREYNHEISERDIEIGKLKSEIQEYGCDRGKSTIGSLKKEIKSLRKERDSGGYKEKYKYYMDNFFSLRSYCIEKGIDIPDHYLSKYTSMHEMD